jgi:kynurenine formamidase
VLIDYATYAERQGIPVSHFGNHPITLDVILAIAKEQGVEFREGDILFLRTGYATKYKTLSEEERANVSGVKEWCGLGQGKDTTQWLWDRQFAAVASDSPGFEVRRKYLSSLNTRAPNGG